VILAAVVCPHPPLLLRELCGARDAIPELRAACREALASALASRPDVVVVVGGAERAGEWDPSLPVDVRGFGTPDAPRVPGGLTTLPLSLGVGKRLLEEAGWDGEVRQHSVSWDADAGAVADLADALGKSDERAVLLVLADGSARRGEKAPGYLDQRAFAYDDEIGRALDEGDADALTRLDPALGAALMVLGRAPLGVLGEVVSAQGARPRARVLYRDDPFGVQYTVAMWDLA
jgi:hypothetical protein